MKKSILEDNFVKQYLAKEEESIEEAKARLKAEANRREEKEKREVSEVCHGSNKKC